MTSKIYNLPSTVKGRELLRMVLPAACDGRLPDGLPIAGTDWDSEAIKVEQENAAFEEWRARGDDA